MSQEHPNVVMPTCGITKTLSGQKAIVTGASSGIGTAVAVSLAKAGADVVINYGGNEDSANNVVAQIKANGGNAIAIQADVSKEDDVERMFAKTIEVFGTVDILVNNAGLQRDAPIDQMSLKDWNRVIDVNLTGQFLCARAAIREFKKRGVVANVSCSAGKIIPSIAAVNPSLTIMANALRVGDHLIDRMGA